MCIKMLQSLLNPTQLRSSHWRSARPRTFDHPVEVLVHPAGLGHADQLEDGAVARKDTTD